jgi:pimeloyl-ACP methyl ester carboxylesterase
MMASMTMTIKHFRHRLGRPPLYTDHELTALTMPTRFIGGTKDALRDTEKIAARLHRLVPRLKIDLIPGAGHAINDTASSMMPCLLEKINCRTCGISDYP